MLLIEEYLRTSYENLDPEFVDGQLIQRTGTTFRHGQMKTRLAEIFYELRRTGLPFLSLISLRLRVGPDRVRIPAFCVYAERLPQEQCQPSLRS